MDKFSTFTKTLLILWSLFMFAGIGFISYASFHFGTARWIWRPVEITGSTTYVKNGISYKDTYKVIIK